MQAQVSNSSVCTSDDPRQVLAGWLDDYAADRCERDDVREIFASVSRSSSEAPWIALALLDQYQRLDRIDTSLALELKSEVNLLVFGAAQPSPASQVAAPLMEQHSTVQSKPTRHHEIAANPATAKQSDTHDEFHALEDTVITTIQVEELQQPHEEPVAASARRILQQRYELVEQISSNASGTVYKALDRQREHLQRDERYVSVKIIRLDEANLAASTTDIHRGFYRAQSLNHPNILSIFNIERDGDICFAVMELLHGERLSTLLQHFNRQTIPWPYARNILRGVGAALVYAHDRGVPHGNLQPQNVMITHTGEVKVLGFGLVSPHRPEPWISDEAAPATLHHEPPRHSGIERIDALEPHPSDDVFSLACIAYELLCGRHPYDGRSVSLAKTQGRRPARSIRFNQRQWRVLKRALILKRDDRKISIRELLTGLGCEHAPMPLAPSETLLKKCTDRPLWQQPALLTAVSLLVVTAVAYVFALSPLGRSQQQGETISSTEQPASEQPPTSITQSDTDTVTPIPTDSPEGENAPTIVNSNTSVVVGSSIVEGSSLPSIDPATLAVDARVTLPETTYSSATTQLPDITASLNTEKATAATTAEAITFTKDSFVNSEGEGTARAVIRRSGRLDKAAQVRWSLIGDSAKPGEDYADTGSGIVEIPAGVREYTLHIPLASDAVRESTEVFTVKLERVDNDLPVREPTTAAVIVVDDD